VDETSRQRLGELADELDGLLDGADLTTEMQCLVHLADGFVGVLLHEVERVRTASSGSPGIA
jgi:hypothetical protein